MAIQKIEELPDSVVAFEASGKVTDADYRDHIMPAVEACQKKHDKVRLMYVLGAGFEGYEASAMWDDAKVGLRHFGSWEKIAFVTDDKTYATAVKAFGFAMPGEVKVFALSALDDAKAWVAG